MTSIYDKDYFNEGIFSTDYTFVANVIMDHYQPKTIIEFGCGNGSLSIALNELGATVDAIDGYSEPDFASYPG
jgi:2-polyprenyl-3-methyl-5-hydroxy-6-metoxy-1,4-benzoquinol methylase